MIKIACPSCKKSKWRRLRAEADLAYAPAGGKCLTCRRKFDGYRPQYNPSNIAPGTAPFKRIKKRAAAAQPTPNREKSKKPSKRRTAGD